MFRYLVLSDTHGDISGAKQLIEQYHDRIQGVLHLGDLSRDFESLRNLYQDRYGLAFLGVPGNCDFVSADPDQRVFKVEGRTVMMVHGHKHAVKFGTEYLAGAARRAGADIALYGHTHIPFTEEKNGILILNPGSISEPRGGSDRSCALLEIDGKKAAAVLYSFKAE